MKEEKTNLTKLELIQMKNVSMKNELISRLIEDIEESNSSKNQKEKYTKFVNSFIEDLFTIINQQILICALIYETSLESKIENIINNSKSISFNLILNFFNKILFSLKERLKSNSINYSRNYSSSKLPGIKKISNLIDKSAIGGASSNEKIILKDIDIKNNFENTYFKSLSYKTNLNGDYNSNKNSRKSSKGNIKYLIINNNNNYSNNIKNISNKKNSYTNIKSQKLNINSFRINLDKLKDNDGKEIKIHIKSNIKRRFDTGIGGVFDRSDFLHVSKKEKKLYNGNNYNNNIIFIKQEHKGCYSYSIKKYKDYLKNERHKKNSFNKKIQKNKMNIENSKISLKNSDGKKEKEINMNNIIIKKKTSSYKPFRPRNNKYPKTPRIEKVIDDNNSNKEIENFNLTQKMPKNNYDIDNIINNSINNQQNVFSEKILYDFNNSEII